MKRRARMLLAVLGTVSILTPLAILWQTSRVPATLSVLDMGYADHGRAAEPGHSGHGGPTARDMDSLIADPSSKADVVVELEAAASTLTIGGQPVAGFTLNGTSPGPTIEATEGDLVEVRLRNASVSAGVALHWHGLDVPNAMDGVAGVTQDAVPAGEVFTYRFVAEQKGTYWYHSHQVSHEQVVGGLFGAIVIAPAKPDRGVRDVLIASHAYAGIKTLNGQPGDLRIPARKGEVVRLRVINTDNGPIEVWADTAYKILAVDGTDVHEPGEVKDASVTLTAGGRVDLGLTVPSGGIPARVQVSKGTAVILGDGDLPPEPRQPPRAVDLLSYGQAQPLAFDPTRADRTFDYRIGRRPGFVRGKPGLWWSINGNLYPNVPMFMVRDDDVVVMRIENRSGEVHPMHLHGHHAVVLARNGVRATGSPWWFDSLNVRNKETYDIAFVADNPGIWMDHCHNLQHAADGMVAHLMYEGVSTPYVLGGTPDNQPE